jgi:micrococcal nuclease
VSLLAAVPRAFWVTSAVVVGTLAVTGGLAVAVSSGDDDSDTATVDRVVDGDTVDVVLDGEVTRVRLLNVDTPETVDPDEPVQCMGPEATAFLTELLPAGTTVQLLYDEEREDRYGRVLAGVTLDDELVNATIAAEGLGVAVLYEPNGRFFGAVQAAEAAARDAGAGLFDPAIACTLPAQVASLAQTVDEAEQFAAGAGAGVGLDVYDDRIGKYAAAAATASALATLLDGDDHLTAAHGSTWLNTARREVAEGEQALGSAGSTLTEARASEAARLEEERRAAEAAEAARVAAEEAARAAEAARQAELARLAEEARQAAAARQAEAERARQQGSSAGTGSSGGGSSTYTGCRKYAPGGKTWTPIPCP